MSFSPTAFILSAIISGSALGGLITAPDRHYQVKSDRPLGSILWIDAQDSSSLPTVFTSAEIDVCLRPRLFEVDIRQLDEVLAEHRDRSQIQSPNNYDSKFLLATTIMVPASPLQYNRTWPGSCKIPPGDQFINAWAFDADLPYDAIPISHGAEEEVSACLKIDNDGSVVDFRFAQPVMEMPEKIAVKIELAARKCWEFGNQSGVEGWIQVGLDQRSEGNET